MVIYSLASQPGPSSYKLPLTQPTEYPVHRAVGWQNYPSEYYLLGSQEPEDIGTGIPEPLLTPEECSESPSSWDELPTSGLDSPGQPDLCDSTPSPLTQRHQMLYEGNYIPCPDPAILIPCPTAGTYNTCNTCKEGLQGLSSLGTRHRTCHPLSR